MPIERNPVWEHVWQEIGNTLIEDAQTMGFTIIITALIKIVYSRVEKKGPRVEENGNHSSQNNCCQNKIKGKYTKAI